MAKDITPADPRVVLDLLYAFRSSKVMFAAVSLGIFDSLEERAKASDVLATELEVNAQALEQLLDACVGLGLLTRVENGYANTPAAATYLCRSSHRRLTGYVHFSNEFLWNLWDHLEEAVREGSNRWKQTFGWDGPIFSNIFHSEEAKRDFLMGMHGYGRISSPKVVSAFDLCRFRRLVDLGGATGHLAIAACERYPGLRAVVFDLPAAVGLAREIVGASAVAQRIEVVAGDFFTDALPEGDLYSLGRILHDWTEVKIIKLLSKIYERLPRGGALLVAEKLLDEDKAGPSLAHLQSLNMLACAEGKERSLSEYESLLKQAGFAEISGCRTPASVDAVLALKE